MYKTTVLFYRKHPDKFVEDYLGIKLNKYQRILTILNCYKTKIKESCMRIEIDNIKDMILRPLERTKWEESIERIEYEPNYFQNYIDYSEIGDACRIRWDKGNKFRSQVVNINNILTTFREDEIDKDKNYEEFCEFAKEELLNVLCTNQD